MSLNFRRIHSKTPALESLWPQIKKRLQHRYFLVNFAKIFRIPFYRTPGRLLLAFHWNSLIKMNLSEVSTIGCLVFFGNFVDKRPQRSQFIFNTWNLKISECYHKHFQLNHTQTSSFFIKTLYNCDSQSFQEHSTLMKICLNIMRKL